MADKPTPGPWVAIEIGSLLGGEPGPAFIRIKSADGARICDLMVHGIVGGPGVAAARANAAWIIEHGPKE
ncbi:hypothetical protein [Reyranella sp.]|uniref:hypothetical protein n=1 Tax=Reyranella sp. TaxID=1929291 RepID=UPI003D0FC088